MDNTVDESLEDATERARLAWDEGKPEEAARILEAWAAAHPERAHELKGRGVAGPVPEAPLARPATMPCLRCGTPMPYRGRVRLHEGGNLAPFLLGDVGELFVDLLHLDAYGCPECGRLEFFMPGLARDVRAPRETVTPAAGSGPSP